MVVSTNSIDSLTHIVNTAIDTTTESAFVELVPRVSEAAASVFMLP